VSCVKLLKKSLKYPIPALRRELEGGFTIRIQVSSEADIKQSYSAIKCKPMTQSHETDLPLRLLIENEISDFTNFRPWIPLPYAARAN
jgi:hypothetical protein